MRITNYPDIINKEYACPCCGCSFVLVARDIRSGYVQVDDGILVTGCPCCNTQINLAVAESPNKKILEELDEMFRRFAEQIKNEEQSQVRAGRASLLDELYTEFCDKKKR